MPDLGEHRSGRPEANHWVDDGECPYTGRKHFPQPHPVRDPGEFRFEHEARAEFERLEKSDPGQYVVFCGSGHGDLWCVRRKADMPVGAIART